MFAAPIRFLIQMFEYERVFEVFKDVVSTKRNTRWNECE